MDKIRVMLVEDHVLVREGTKKLVDLQEDMKVIAEAGDGEEAIRLADIHHPDVIIMDIAMPKLNGLEATKQIKATNPSTAIFALTAFDDERYILGLLDAGAAGYLLKDVRSDELIRAIRAVHIGESVLHPAVARKVMDRVRTTVEPPVQRMEEDDLDQLTRQELQVLKLAARWMTNGEIASQLGISARMVQDHLGNVFGKLGVGSRTEAVLYALRKGWLSSVDAT